MSKTIKVSLDKKVSPPVLKLEHYGHAHMDKASTPQTIVWKLHGELAQSQFTTASFLWLVTPQSGIFSTPTPNGNTLSMTDNHKDDLSDGDWPYQLSVDFNGTTYRCPPRPTADDGDKSLKTASLAKDPIIINH